MDTFFSIFTVDGASQTWRHVEYFLLDLGLMFISRSHTRYRLDKRRSTGGWGVLSHITC